jgi:uncharacterized membrane protein YkvI
MKREPSPPPSVEGSGKDTPASAGRPSAPPPPQECALAGGQSPSSQFKEAWVIFFILGIIMINYPFIHIFNKSDTLFGIPLLVLYFLLGWPLSILVIYLFTRHVSNLTKGPPETGGGSGDE